LTTSEIAAKALMLDRESLTAAIVKLLFANLKQIANSPPRPLLVLFMRSEDVNEKETKWSWPN